MAILSRRLAANGVGAGKRWHVVPNSYRPSKDEIIENLKKEGPEGGMSAKDIDLEEQKRQGWELEEILEMREEDGDVADHVWADLKGIGKAFFKQKIRIGALSWSLPVAVFRALFLPAWLGIG